MTRKLTLGLLASAIFAIFACKQEITNDEIKQVESTRPNADELAKSYSYSTVKVAKGFGRFANLLKVEDPATASLFGMQELNNDAIVNIYDVTDAKAKLGRVLFYDKKLSLNSNVACGSCHHQSKGFADGKQFSAGFEGRVTTRNSMAIVSPGMIRSGMFWDRRVSKLSDMTLNPVQNHIEMGMEDLKLLETKLSGIEYYPQLFADAYGAPVIRKELIAEAMTAFLRSMVSWDSKFDQGVRNNSFNNLNSEEKRGLEIFMGSTAIPSTTGGFSTVATGACNSCHSAPMFNDGNLVNAYYDVDFLANVTGGGIDIGLDMQSKDKGTPTGGFKIPSLRNIELTGPYMHDGRFKTLEEVVEHYNTGVKPSANLSARLKDSAGKPKKLNLSDSDKRALVAFMKTLTDKSFVNDPKYSDPFKN